MNEEANTQLMIDVAVLSDQTKRTMRQLEFVEEKLEEIGERLAKIETSVDHNTKSTDNWTGWIVAGLMVAAQIVFQIVTV